MSQDPVKVTCHCKQYGNHKQTHTVRGGNAKTHKDAKGSDLNMTKSYEVTAKYEPQMYTHINSNS